MTIVLDGSAGITNDGGYTGDGVVFADTTPANTLVTTTGGNVGIGTVPGVKLDVKPADLGTTAGNTSYAYRATISSVGNTDQFDVLWYRSASASGWSNADLILQRNVDGSVGQSKIIFGGGNYTSFWTNGSERARFDSAGHFVQAAGCRIYSIGTYNLTTAAAANLNVDGNGTFFRSTSALKYKKDIRDLENIDVNLFRAVRYKSKSESDDQTKDHFGIVADEVHAAGVTELVNYGVDGEVEGFQYERLTVVLLKHCQEQQAIITALTARVAALEGK